MVRCTRYWTPVIDRILILKDPDASAEDKESAEKWIESFCQKDEKQMEYILAHGEFMMKYGDEFPLAVIGVPDAKNPDLIKPAAESAFRNLRRAEAKEDFAVVKNTLGILNALIMEKNEAERKPVTAREVNRILGKVEGGKVYVTKASPKERRLSAIVKVKEYKLIEEYALKKYPDKKKSINAVSALMNDLVSDLLATIRKQNRAPA